MFKPTTAKPDFVKLEKKLLKWWYEKGIVEKYLHKNDKSKKRFRFLDGPITANNPMGVHHAWGRTYKDFFQRYKNMRGFKQRFQNGFDCQGLWLEVEEERDLGFNSKRDIEDFGVAKFCRQCRQRVDKFSKIQTDQSKRLGMFMDWENSYYTMSETNNEYIWYFLKKCHEKGWLYKGINSMPWCTRCGTALSAHELSDGGYQMVEHDSIYLKFPLKDQKKTSLLIWTTTPWTLLANVAVAVHPQLTYAKVKIGNEFLILAKSRLGVIAGKYKSIDQFKGKKLLGLKYEGPFDELKTPSEHKKAHQIIEWAEVSEREGTGLVHIAPGAGAEDFSLAKEFDLPVIAPLDEFGDYTSGFGDFSGKNARKVNDLVFKSLKEKGLLYKVEKITHSYPVCWRCKEEVVFRVTEEWFISVKEIRPHLKKVARTVRWIPESVGKRMQDWLTNMGDWPISRRRYWGLALPFWQCPSGHLTVVGSRQELKKLAVDPKKVDKLPELHRPWIDEIKIKCPKCSEVGTRTPFVGDCWLDAGIVAFSTLKYLEDREHWKKWFPAELVAEYVPQVKLWFYTLLFMSVTLENKAPYEAVHTHQFVVDEKGEAMHKSKGNAIWFDDAAEKMGVDVMRWMYLRADNTRDLRFGFQLGDEVRRQFHLLLWNVYNFFVTYANVDGWKPRKEFKKKPPKLDLWILTRLDETVIAVSENLDNYDAQTAVLVIEEFVQDLSTWHIRRSRNRIGPTAEDGFGSLHSLFG
jgi:isoleucyl-tRNA synthetase